MNLRLLILILFSTALATVQAQELEVRDRGRNWSSSELSRENLSSSFEKWLGCFKNPQAEGCCAPMSVVDISHLEPVVNYKCLPSPRDRVIAFSSKLPKNLRRERDQAICNCFLDDGAGPLERYAYNSPLRAEENRPRTGRRSNPQLTARAADAAANGVNDADYSYWRDIFEDKASLMLSITSFAQNPEEFRQFSAYDSKPSQTTEQNNADSSPRSAASGIGVMGAGNLGAIAGAVALTPSEKQANQNTDNYEFTYEQFAQTPVPAGSCIPYRNFASSAQFPREAEFFEGLDKAGDDRSEWNYSRLVDRLGARELENGEEATLKDPEFQRDYQRLIFLRNNPEIRNIFLADDKNPEFVEVKNKLLKVLKELPRPRFANGKPLPPDEKWQGQMEKYRFDFMNVMKDEAAIKANDNGNKIFRGTARQLYRVVNSSGVSDSSEVELGQEGTMDPAQWKNFCEKKSAEGARMAWSLITQIPRRNPLRPEEDMAYKEANESVCGDRLNEKGEKKNFNQFAQAYCQQQNKPLQSCLNSNRETILAEFLSTYPRTPNGQDANDKAAYVLPFLTRFKPISVDKATYEQYTVAARDRARFERPIRFSSSEYASLNQSSSAPVPANAVSRTPASAASNSTVSSLQVPSQPSPEFGPVGPLSPSLSQTAAPIQSVQSNLDKGESDAKEIRQQISSLREVMGKDSSQGGPRDSKEFTSLTARLDALERQLAEKEQSNQLLRDQLDQQRVAESSQQTNPPRSNRQDSGNSSPSFGQSSQSVAPQGGSSAGFNSAGPSFGGGASLNSGVGGGVLAPVTRSLSSGGAMNSALLSRYGIQPASSDGAITVADDSSKINYQQLASDSGSKSVIEVPFSLADIQRLSGEEIGKFAPKSNGVYPVAFNDGSSGFLVRDGDQISVVPGQTEIARMPASVESVPLEPSVRLRDLQRELGQ